MSQLRKEEILSQIAAGEMSVDQAAVLLANLDKSPARTPAVDIRDPHRAMAEYVRRVFPGIESKDCKSVIIPLSKLDRLHARVCQAVRNVGIDHEARAEALRAFQDVFGSGLPRRIESDNNANIILDIRAKNEGDSVRTSAFCQRAKRSKSTSKKREAETAATPINNTSRDTTNAPPRSAAPANTLSHTMHNPISDEERRAVFAALDAAGESLGTTLLSVKSKIDRRRLEEILPFLLNEGALKQLGKGNSARYTRP
jgi:hypothetical protein